MLIGDQLVAVGAAGHEAILDMLGARELVHQGKARDHQRQQQRDRRQPAGLTIGD